MTTVGPLRVLVMTTVGLCQPAFVPTCSKGFVVEDVKSGKGKAMGALVGQVMKRSQGKFPPALVNEVLNKKLGL